MTENCGHDSITDVGMVATAGAVRAGDPKWDCRGDAASLRAAMLRRNGDLRAETKASPAGLHIAKVLDN